MHNPHHDVERAFKTGIGRLYRLRLLLDVVDLLLGVYARHLVRARQFGHLGKATEAHAEQAKQEE